MRYINVLTYLLTYLLKNKNTGLYNDRRRLCIMLVGLCLQRWSKISIAFRLHAQAYT